MRRITTSILLCLVIIPSVCYSVKDVSDPELQAIMKSWRRKCADFAAGEGVPALEKRCFNGVLAGVKEVDDLRTDDAVSEQMWDVCKAESGFNYTGDFHAWAACMRIARTRRGLRDY